MTDPPNTFSFDTSFCLYKYLTSATNSYKTWASNREKVDCKKSAKEQFGPNKITT